MDFCGTNSYYFSTGIKPKNVQWVHLVLGRNETVPDVVDCFLDGLAEFDEFIPSEVTWYHLPPRSFIVTNEREEVAYSQELKISTFGSMGDLLEHVCKETSIELIDDSLKEEVFYRGQYYTISRTVTF